MEDDQNRARSGSGCAGPAAPNRPDPPQRGPRPREVQVTGLAADWCRTDRVALGLRVGTSKDSVHDASGSVSRRLEYIQQTLRQHGVKDEEVCVRRSVHREDSVYHVEAEATVNFSDFEVMDRVCCVLLEKLDKSVSMGTPRFYHSPESLSKLRRRVCLAAVENAQQKASDLSRLLGQTLGPPLLVREEETQEWRSREEGDEEEEEEKEEEEDGVERHGAAATRYLSRHRVVARASSRVSVTFVFLDKARKKH